MIIDVTKYQNQMMNQTKTKSKKHTPKKRKYKLVSKIQSNYNRELLKKKNYHRLSHLKVAKKKMTEKPGDNKKNECSGKVKNKTNEGKK